jgi:WD40 repeat protein
MLLLLQVVTGASDSTVAVWDLATGEAVSAFANAHEENEITCMAFDAAGSRLITGARNGTTKTWNFQSGHNLQVSHRLTAWGGRRGRRRPQAACPVARKAVSGVARLQGVEG